jgi:hypothetical protein
VAGSNGETNRDAKFLETLGGYAQLDAVNKPLGKQWRKRVWLPESDITRNRN